MPTSESNAELLSLFLEELGQVKDETIKENVLMHALSRTVAMKNFDLSKS